MKKYFPFIIVAVLLLLGGTFIVSNVHKDKASQHHAVEQSHRSYEIEVTKKANADQIVLNEPTAITYRIKNDQGEIVKNFAIAHEKVMHFILVRKDLTQFQHLHPEYDENTGEFTVPVVFTVDGPYRFFADFTPAQDNPHKLPVTVYGDIPVGDVSSFQPHAITPDTTTEKTVPQDYQVSYTFPNEIKSQTSVTYSLTVTKNNQPVTLEKYLGALGHSVVLKEGTLEYIHSHAGEQNDTLNHAEHEGHAMSAEDQSNRIDFTTTFPESGNYKVFTQFQHEGNVYTTDYTITVK